MKKNFKKKFRQLYRNILKILPKKIVLNIENIRGYHKCVNFKNPMYFGEKIQCLKLYGKLEKYTDYVDKYLVREYINQKLGEEFLIPLLEVYDNPEEIEYDKLPNRFVIKLNTGSGYNIIVDDKKTIKKEQINTQLKRWLKEDYYKIKKEDQYKNINKKILIEKYIENKNGDLQDFKFYCFDGKIEFIEVDFDRFSNHTMNFYSPEWKLLKLNKGDYQNYSESFDKPLNFEMMKESVEKIAKDFQFARIDFYDVDGKIYFGEITLTPAGGLTPFNPIDKDIEYAKKIKIPQISSKKILYIGRVSKKRKILDGVTIKAKVLQEYLQNGNNAIKSIDVDNWNKKKLSLSLKIILGYLTCDEIVLCTSSPGASKVLKFLKLVHNKKKVYYFVSGGNLYKKIKEHVYPLDLYKNLYKIYVESEFMKQQFLAFGLQQTEVRYNFRNPKITFKNIKKTEEKVRFVFYGRVVKEKGIETAIELIRKLTKNHYNVELNIFGQVNMNYLMDLDIEKDSNINYLGPIKPDSIKEYKILHNYDIFIFPTEHDGEGLPGALIDAYISGLCVVAADWQYAREYIKDETTGVIFKYKDYDDLYTRVVDLLDNVEKIDLYKKMSLKESKKYIAKYIIPKELTGGKNE